MEWYELQCKMNKFNKPDYQNCDFKVIRFDASDFQNDYCAMQSVYVEGPNGSEVKCSFMVPSGAQAVLTPEHMNTVISGRVKVINDTSQYAYNGRKFTFAFLAEKKSGGNNSSGSTSGGYKSNYVPDTPGQIAGKCYLQLLAHYVSRENVDVQKLAMDDNTLAALKDMAFGCIFT